jgi:anti-sigma factor RsiW
MSLAQDDALSARDHIRLERHIEECPSCSVLGHDLARIVSELKATTPAHASDTFVLELDRRLSARAPRCGLAAVLPRSSGWYRAVAVAAGCAAIAAVGLSAHVRTVRADEMRRREMASSIRTTGVQSMALAASNPLDDITVANLAADAGTERGGEDLL